MVEKKPEETQHPFGPVATPRVLLDRAVQLTLRQIDMEPLAVALVELSEEDRDIFLRNMSKRAAGMLQEEISELERHPKGTFDQRSTRVQEKIHALLEKHLKLTQENEELTPSDAPFIRWRTEDELIDTLVQLKRYKRKHGDQALATAVMDDLPPLLKKGLELFVDGWDPSFIHSTLEQMKESLVTKYVNMQNIILEGIGALSDTELPQATEEKLKAFRLSGE